MRSGGRRAFMAGCHQSPPSSCTHPARMSAAMRGATGTPTTAEPAPLSSPAALATPGATPAPTASAGSDFALIGDVERAGDSVRGRRSGR
eukprot:4141556-Alexandrium_andersonii.AAC.1